MYIYVYIYICIIEAHSEFVKAHSEFDRKLCIVYIVYTHLRGIHT